MTEEQLRARYAIEALRSGVPNRAVVESLGCNQPRAMKKFGDGLQNCTRSLVRNAQAVGLILSGGFGSGKSHILKHYEALSLASGFVCSRIAISKETPMYDLAKLFKAAIYQAVLPDRRGPVIQEVLARLDFHSEAFEKLVSITNSVQGSQLAATLFLLRKNRSDLELLERIYRFWSGDAMPIVEIKQALSVQQGGAQFTPRACRAADLAIQKLSFAVKLMMAAGYRGWVILIDEFELVGSYGLLQRAKSYAELARLLGISQEAVPGVLSAVALTDDFVSAVIYGKRDIEQIPKMERIGVNNNTSKLDAIAGIRALSKEAVVLDPPDLSELAILQSKISTLYEQAYSWRPTQTESAQSPTSSRVRHHIKSWITSWDISRLCGVGSIGIQTEEIRNDYAETEPTEEEDVMDELLKVLTRS